MIFLVIQSDHSNFKIHIFKYYAFSWCSCENRRQTIKEKHRLLMSYQTLYYPFLSPQVQRLGKCNEDRNRKMEQEYERFLVLSCCFSSTSLWKVCMDSQGSLMQVLGNVFGSSDSAAEQIWRAISHESCAHPASQLDIFSLVKELLKQINIKCALCSIWLSVIRDVKSQAGTRRASSFESSLCHLFAMQDQ